MKILIVDDDEEARYMLEVLLRGHGYEVESAADGVEALEKASQDGLDLIISDIMMPRMDGFQLCREVKTNEKLKNIAFVFYTATYTDSKDEDFALSLGAEKFIVKPAEPDVFIEILRGVIKSYETGVLAAPKPPVEEEPVYFKRYNERLVRKLEDKVLQLENANKALEESERKYKELIDNANDAVIVVGPTGYLSFVNPRFCEMTGYSMEEAKKLDFSKLVHPEDLAMVTERFRERLAGEEVPRNYELRMLTRAGETIYIDYNSSTIEREGKIVGILGILRDIAERKKAEEELKESEEQYRSIINLGGTVGEAIIMMQDTEQGDAIHTFVSKEWPRITGYSEKELLGMSFFDLLHPKYREASLKRHEKKIGGEAIPHLYEMSIIRKDGTEVPIELTSAYTTYKGEHANVAFIRDITERKQAEENIKQVAEEWRVTFDSIVDPVSIHDKNFKLVRVNKAYADVFKMKPGELIGKTCYEVFHGTKEPPPNCPHKQTLETKKPHTAEFFEPHLGVHFEFSTSPIFNEKGEVTGSVHIAKDITERKQMEEQLIVTDRLASIGELASGIAHELNNPLTSVIGFSDLLLDKKDVPDDIREDLSIINKEAQRTAGVVRNLLTFARKHPQEKQSVDINSVIEKVLELRAYEQKVTNIEVNTQLAPDLPEITANIFDLQQVFLNIIINAEYFMTEAHGRGIITITTERIGDVIRASFADDGPGIAKENLVHLFDPFFTTKEVGKGTGLGLSICHGIITAHDGRIYAESELGKGATFIVELPLTTPDKGGTKK